MLIPHCPVLLCLLWSFIFFEFHFFFTPSFLMLLLQTGNQLLVVAFLIPFQEQGPGDEACEAATEPSSVHFRLMH